MTQGAALEIVRKWANERVQWGQPIGKHEAIAHKIARHGGAPRSRWRRWPSSPTSWPMREGYDIRLEAAMAKEWTHGARRGASSTTTLQIRGGRGYETEQLAGARAARRRSPIERMLRDCRINLIFEGSSEIMHLFIAREAVDKHLEVAGALIDPKKTHRREAGGAAEGHRVLCAVVPDALARLEPVAEVLRARRARPSTCASATAPRAGSRARCSTAWSCTAPSSSADRRSCSGSVDIANELFAMTAAIARAERMRLRTRRGAGSALELTRRVLPQSERASAPASARLWRNDDKAQYALAQTCSPVAMRWIEHTAPRARSASAWHEAPVEAARRRPSRRNRIRPRRPGRSGAIPACLICPRP